MAKKKKVSEGADHSFFSFGDPSDKKSNAQVNVIAVLKVFAIAVVLVAIGFGFVVLERYVKTAPNVQHRVTKLKIDKPFWVSPELMDRIKEVIKSSSQSHGEDFLVDDKLTFSIAKSLTKVAWLYDLNIHIDGDSLVISAKWRKPIAVFQAGEHERYISSDFVVLEYIPVKGLPLIDLKGFQAKKFPEIGEVWEREDVAAAVELIKVLEKMDQRMCPDNPLLFQVSAIDIGNFNCRQSSRMPQIILFAKDGTNINWGAPVGSAQRYIEAPENEKLAMLYDFYKVNGKLELDGYKYIELRIPQKNVPSPVSTQ
jgi:hypothetical protein